jgi:coenzyme F420 biosynthesis associated uncharacterized protein
MDARDAGPVDWEFARRTAQRVAGPGPQIGLSNARQAVVDLRQCAEAAVPLIAERSGLSAPAEPGGVVVVDRSGWTDANARAFRSLLEPLVHRLQGADNTHSVGVGAKVTGAEIGFALGFLSSKVLGQYELFTESDAHTPRLLLVAPNIVNVELELGLVPRDFRLWVCLHEETHRVQFTANPWLGPWLRAQIDNYLNTVDLGVGELLTRSRQVLAAVWGALRGMDAVSVLEQSMTADERALLDQLTAVMSLLEGHAEVMMDSVGPDVLPSIGSMRSSLNDRRTRSTGRDAFLRRLLGMESKLAQYRDGARFVRVVTEEIGIEAFNQVWTSPETLPTREELNEPVKWVARVGAG